MELKRWVSGDLAAIRLTEGSLGGKVEEAIEKINKEIDFKKGQRDKLVKLVSTFKGLDNKILKLKYVDGMTLDDIAHELNYSTSHIRKKHAELIRTIKFVDEYCSI